jgi:hypothetical protein
MIHIPNKNANIAQANCFLVDGIVYAIDNNAGEFPMFPNPAKPPKRNPRSGYYRDDGTIEWHELRTAPTTFPVKNGPANVLDDLITHKNDDKIPARPQWVCAGLAANPTITERLRADLADGALCPASRMAFLAQVRAQFDQACKGDEDDIAANRQVAYAIAYLDNALQVASARKAVLREWYLETCFYQD